MSRSSNGCFRCPDERKPCKDKRHKCTDCNGLGMTATYELCQCSKTKPRRGKLDPTLVNYSPGRGTAHNRRRRTLRLTTRGVQKI